MSEQLRESLSAAMDDEADAFELRRVLDEAKADPRLREQWQRLHLIRDLMQETPHAYAPELRAAVWAELLAEQDENEEASTDVTAVGGTKMPGDQAAGVTRRRITGGVVAAVVALVVVLNGDLFVQDPAPEIAEDFYMPTEGLQRVEQITAADRQRRNAYFVTHTQYRAMNEIGVAGFTKMVTFDTSRMQAGEEQGGIPIAQ